MGATKISSRDKKRWKLLFSGYFSKAKIEECNQTNWSDCDKFDMIMSALTTYFADVGAHFSLKASFRGKKLLKFRFLGCCSKSKTEDDDQKDWSYSNKFGIIKACSATYHLEVGSTISLQVATKACFWGKKNFEKQGFYATFLKQKRSSATKKTSLSNKFRMLTSDLDTYFLEVSAHSLVKIATKGFFRGKKISKFSIFRLFFWSENRGVRLK